MRIKLAIFVGILAGAFLSLGLAGSASAHTPVIPGSPCSNVGQVGDHAGQQYRCEKHLGDTCSLWHWTFSSSVPKSGKTAWPHPSCPCVSGSATPTPTPTPSTTPVVSPSTSPADTSSPQPVHSTAVAVGPVRSLPVTGSPVVALGSLGGALLALGGLALYAARERARRTVRP